jgi:hypothetical protein
MGTPGGDKAKYRVMSNDEFDYDQIWCARQREGWIAPPSSASDLANGYDTRYLFSFGPFEEIGSDSVLKLTTGYVCGADLHLDPTNYENNLQESTSDSGAIATYYNNLDFTDFATNSQWADWVYDNPGVDTDSLTDPFHYRGKYRITASGDTFWYKGDGVPDFAGPPPPPSPRLSFETARNQITLIWDGKETEHKVDKFSNKQDFEGYRIYMSKTGRADDYTILGDFDLEDFDYVWWDTTKNPAQWSKWTKPPKKLINFESGFDPDTARLVDLVPDPYQEEDQVPSWNKGHFIPYGWNTGLDRIILDSDDTTYTYTMDNISESQGLYFAVTAYDYGNPVTKLSSLESAPSINAKLVFPIERGTGENVMVYPNPYFLSKALEPATGYLDMGWEDPDGSGNTQFDRRIIFSGLPNDWIIRIFTVDGDLVKQIQETDAYYQLAPGVCFWDLISRNTQAVVSGLYIYAIDGAGGYHELGKIAIIK